MCCILASHIFPDDGPYVCIANTHTSTFQYRRYEHIVHTLHVGIFDEGVEEVGGLHEREAAVTQRCDRGVHSDS